MARKGILQGTTNTPPAPSERPKPAPRGAVGALQSSLNKLQENAVQEIDANLIDDGGFADRLGVDGIAQKQLRDSLKTYGQQVPVLLRPHAKQQGRFEIVYGRRRLAALKELGLPVKAMVRQLDDHALVMAQGQENTARQDLSFIEKASFAAQLKAAGYERQTIADALSIDLPMLSRMLTVGECFDLKFLKLIGAAPGVGRDRWLALVKLFDDPAARSRAHSAPRLPDFAGKGSDDRFEAVMARAKGKAAKKTAGKTEAAGPRALRNASGQPLADLRSTGKGVVLTVQTKNADGFDRWFEENAETLLQEIHDQWKKERSEDVRK
ncbi:Plasmid partitioning protein RepB-8 [Sulfitobacter noctilucicola]|uniref:ParB family chromosome partitioning protein n=1 Tax=Sulfitobacter noctilucicola TaxID=1342301 RepID=A0A7W6Q6B9_9RHOB|nr:plasmid partitioning protein RepB [Sulfitobacter noctilucicola]KIN69813.1 Plasmid partitioning protein RepB-8 [Sulfitobacter noctilucicola]MBB4176199.1 ParB family chromosome partitioning protein [Sulfitobacter noctilucicola]